MFDSAVERIANRRWGVIVLLNGVGGAGDNGIRTRCVGSGGSVRAAERHRLERISGQTGHARQTVDAGSLGEVRTIRSDSRMPLIGLTARLCIVRSSSSRSVGTASPTQLTCSGSGASAEVSVRIPSSSTPDAPSIVAWWVLVNMAHRPSARPSMT